MAKSSTTEGLKKPKAKPRSRPRPVPPAPPAERDASGKFKGRSAKWAINGPEGFWAWVSYVKPRVLCRGGKYEIWQPTRKQHESIDRILVSDGKGGFKHSISLEQQPRRHGKSTMMALIVIWLFTSRENWTCQLSGNTEHHSRRVQYNTLVRIISQTPALRQMIDLKRDIQRFEIRHPKKSNLIQGMTGSSLASAFGDRLNCLWASDWHACPDLGPFNALQASLLDSENTLCLIDSNVDNQDGHVHQLERAARNDPSIYANHLEYFDLDHYLNAAPPWIDRAKAKRLQATLLPNEFDRDILGKRTQAQNSLFLKEDIEGCKSAYKTPVKANIRELTQGRACKIGAGLDRSKSLLGTASGGDNTILTVIAKVAKHNGEPEFFLLDQVNVIPNTAQHIKRLILKAHERYTLDNLTLEEYQAMDIEPWCLEQNIPVELIAAHSTRQNASFPELHRIVKEGRLHFPSEMKELAEEMAGFTYTALKGDKYSFGAAGSGHDDRVYSLNWSIYSLRKEVMAAYALGDILCASLSKNRQFCLLLGGDMRLHCARQCAAFSQVEDYFAEFKRFQTETHLELGQFYKRYVKVTGSLIVQAA